MDDLHAPTVASGPSSQPTTNGTAKKQSLQELIAQKDNIEAELSALGSVLDSHGVNMNTGLTTFDGFPRADIDVAQIRTTRARIIRLKNDHKALMEKMEEAVHEHFAAGKSAESLPPTNTTGSQANVPRGPAITATQQSSSAIGPAITATQQSSSAIEPPFARVNSVVDGSPAATAGMRAGDKVTRFGWVDWTNHERLGKVAQVVQQNENSAILVKVLRDSSTTVQLQLTPRRDWGGRGMLGCHLVPV